MNLAGNAKQSTESTLGRAAFRPVLKALSSAVQGKSDIIFDVLTSILAGGHVLLEDVPGVGKTTLAQSVAHRLGLTFSRIQFTNDLLPSDIIGVQIYRRSDEQFSFVQGPIFAQLVLADEINRTTPKTQSSLLEAMNERRVSVQRETHVLPTPFIVIATQNPTDFQGTYPLPESQLDRFMMRLRLGYPDPQTERNILKSRGKRSDTADHSPLVDPETVLAAFDEVDAIRIEETVQDYLLRIVEATRHSPQFALGVSTRGALECQRAAQARAYLSGRDYVLPDDIKHLAVPVFAHRIQLARTVSLRGASSEQENAILDVLESISVPV